MSQLKVDNITDELGTGAPDFPNGLTGVVPASSITGALNATGSAPIFACRAWVNFNGTGTVAIRASGNVSSITDFQVGDYGVNFTTAMPDANYASVITGSLNNGTSTGPAAGSDSANFGGTPSASNCRIRTYDTGGFAFQDGAFISVAIFR